VRNERDLDDAIGKLLLVFEDEMYLMWYNDSYRIEGLLRDMLKLKIIMVCKEYKCEHALNNVVLKVAQCLYF